MNETAPALAEDEAPPAADSAKDKKEEGSFAVFLLKLVVLVLIFRTFVFTSFSIPSESMMPRLLEGDYLFAAKWPYGYSQASMPFDLPLTGDGRILGRLPDRGDIVIFKHPVDRADYVKRVIGLPGDQVQMLGGVLVINGVAVKKVKIADFVIPVRPGKNCRTGDFAESSSDGPVCRYPQYRETLPNGVSYNVLDLGPSGVDTTDPVVVPEGKLFLMGDNRDNSMDSRFPAVAQQGIGLVPVENLIGRPSFMYFSTDGHAEWVKPWTWFSAARWSRMGRGF